VNHRSILPAAALALLAVCWSGLASAADLGEIRVGVLEFGTVSWELDVIKHHKLDAKHDFNLQVQGFGSGQATDVALQGGAVDAIVDDYLWVSRQRADGELLTFIPYSSTVGTVMVPPGSGIASLAALKGKKIGVAGGPIDKSWLLIRGLATKRHGMDLAAEAEPVYGAPPLLNQKIEDGELDAVLNYWHFAARLEAKGYKPLVGVDDAIAELGVKSVPPQIGYVFRESFGHDHPGLIEAFAAAVDRCRVGAHPAVDQGRGRRHVRGAQAELSGGHRQALGRGGTGRRRQALCDPRGSRRRETGRSGQRARPRHVLADGGLLKPWPAAAKPAR
jgi:NitT/TauT family transport system substrate-binding protein